MPTSNSLVFTHSAVLHCSFQMSHLTKFQESDSNSFTLFLSLWFIFMEQVKHMQAEREPLVSHLQCNKRCDVPLTFLHSFICIVNTIDISLLCTKLRWSSRTGSAITAPNKEADWHRWRISTRRWGHVWIQKITICGWSPQYVFWKRGFKLWKVNK